MGFFEAPCNEFLFFGRPGTPNLMSRHNSRGGKLLVSERASVGESGRQAVNLLGILCKIGASQVLRPLSAPWLKPIIYLLVFYSNKAYSAVFAPSTARSRCFTAEYAWKIAYIYCQSLSPFSTDALVSD